MISTILCPVDFSPISEREVRLASQLCERFGARLVIVHGTASPPPAGLGVSWMHAQEHCREHQGESAETRRRILELISRLPASVKAEGEVVDGPFDRAVLELAAALPASLVIIGTHGRSSAEHRSATERIILDAPCPVFTTRDESPERFLPDLAIGGSKAIPTLVPVDFSPHSERALEYALGLARRLPLELHVLHVDPSGEQDEADLARRLRSRVPADLADRVAIEVRSGVTVDEILRREEGLRARLIVMGTHHKAAVQRLLRGSTAAKVLHASLCPVWFVPEGARPHLAAA